MIYYSGDVRTDKNGILACYFNDGIWADIHGCINPNFIPCEDVHNIHYKLLVKETQKYLRNHLKYSR